MPTWRDGSQRIKARLPRSQPHEGPPRGAGIRATDRSGRSLRSPDSARSARTTPREDVVEEIELRRPDPLGHPLPTRRHAGRTPLLAVRHGALREVGEREHDGPAAPRLDPRDRVQEGGEGDVPRTPIEDQPGGTAPLGNRLDRFVEGTDLLRLEGDECVSRELGRVAAQDERQHRQQPTQRAGSAREHGDQEEEGENGKARVDRPDPIVGDRRHEVSDERERDEDGEPATSGEGRARRRRRPERARGAGSEDRQDERAPRDSAR